MCLPAWIDWLFQIHDLKLLDLFGWTKLKRVYNRSISNYVMPMIIVVDFKYNQVGCHLKYILQIISQIKYLPPNQILRNLRYLLFSLYHRTYYLPYLKKMKIIRPRSYSKSKTNTKCYYNVPLITYVMIPSYGSH